MKLYYLHENNVNVGPFNIEELKAKKITSFTPIWCEGFDTWKTAGEIEELKPILNELPSPTRMTNIEEKPKDNFLGFNKKGIILVLVGLSVILFTLIIMNYQSNKIINIEKANKETQKENYLKKIKSQKLKLEEQSEILTKKGQAEKDRFNKSIIQADENTYKEILSAISNSYKALEDAKEDLEKAKGYRIFRSAKKKEQQINDAVYEIEIWHRKIELLKLEKREVEIRLNQSK
ncbi:DUF4339 domain-containing protein [uncultured Flavobacterium sp.]|uniref:DUF4339 domain-containing protein n=1 Tax=uncultured Flavobacterium sp. TaxID=165435 RepID=UPI0030EE332B